jgi:uncharacterized membrane protein
MSNINSPESSTNLSNSNPSSGLAAKFLDLITPDASEAPTSNNHHSGGTNQALEDIKTGAIGGAIVGTLVGFIASRNILGMVGGATFGAFLGVMLKSGKDVEGK